MWTSQVKFDVIFQWDFKKANKELLVLWVNGAEFYLFSNIKSVK